MPEKSGPPRYYKVGPYILKYAVPPLKVRGTTFFGCINVPKNSGPPRYYKGGPYILKYVVLPLKVRGPLFLDA